MRKKNDEIELNSFFLKINGFADKCFEEKWF